jgi:hypothetical protein
MEIKSRVLYYTVCNNLDKNDHIHEEKHIMFA